MPGVLLSAAASVVVQLSPPAADEDLVGRSIMYNFDAAGWCQGEVVERVDDPEEVDEEIDHPANYLVYYTVDDTQVAHYLHPSEYSHVFPGLPRGWYLLVDT